MYQSVEFKAHQRRILQWTGGCGCRAAGWWCARLRCRWLDTHAGGDVRGCRTQTPRSGLVSRYGNVHTTWSVDCLGPLTRSVEDCALMLQVIAGTDPEDPTTAEVEIPDYRRALVGDLRGVTVACATGSVFAAVDDEIAEAMEAALRELRGLGAEIVDVVVPDVERLNDLQQILTKAERATIYSRALRTRPDEVSFTARSVLYEGFLIPATRYLEALSLREVLLRDHLAAVHAEADVLFTPRHRNPGAHGRRDRNRRCGRVGADVHRVGRVRPFRQLPGNSGNVGALRVHEERLADGLSASRATILRRSAVSRWPCIPADDGLAPFGATAATPRRFRSGPAIA